MMVATLVTFIVSYSKIESNFQESLTYHFGKIRYRQEKLL